MNNFHNSLVGLKKYKEVNLPFADAFQMGNIGSNASPLMIWFNGSTYGVGYKENDQLNQVVILKQTKENVEANTVGNGTTATESRNHPAPCMHIDSEGYIYVFQNKLHVDPFRYWKSDNPEDISSFTLQGEFSDEASYIGVLDAIGKDIKFQTRRGGTSSYAQSIISLNLDTGVNSSLQITTDEFATSNQRHYLFLPKIYGNPTKRVAGIQHRDETSKFFYKTSLWVTSDYETIENISGNFSKNITVDGLITNAEINSHYKITGDDSLRSDYVASNWLIQINDDIYTCIFDQSNYIMRKYTIGLDGVQNSYTIQGLDISADFSYYNGQELVLTGRGAGNKAVVYTMDLGLTDIKYRRTFDFFETGLVFGFPWNLDEVDGRYAILGGTQQETTPPRGLIPYILTKDKFL
jgi:hypothetical protein